MKTSQIDGYTLVELIVVIIIVLLLAALLLPMLPAGGGGPNDDAPDFRQLPEAIYQSAARIVKWLGNVSLYLVLFIVGLLYLSNLWALFPLQSVNCEHLSKFFASRIAKGWFYYVLGVLFLTNFFPSQIVQLVYTPRIYVGFLGALSIGAAHGAYRLACPDSKPERPMLRYGAVVLAGLGLLITMFLQLTLFPAPFQMRPELTWKGLLPG